jgi:hydrogenase maturation protein HypF
MGRLFDAVASLTGLCDRNRYEGEAGLRLEAAAMAYGPAPAYPVACPAADESVFAQASPFNSSPVMWADWRAMIREIAAEMARHEDPARIAARFHETLAAWVVEVASVAGAQRVALSGGCFQNAWLTERCAAHLIEAGLSVSVHQRVPANDGGLALGQVALAAARLAQG